MQGEMIPIAKLYNLFDTWMHLEEQEFSSSWCVEKLNLIFLMLQHVKAKILGFF